MYLDIHDCTIKLVMFLSTISLFCCLRVTMCIAVLCTNMCLVILCATMCYKVSPHRVLFPYINHSQTLIVGCALVSIYDVEYLAKEGVIVL